MLCVLTKTHKQSNQPTNNQTSFLPFSTNWCDNWRKKDRKLGQELQICFPLLTYLFMFFLTCQQPDGRNTSLTCPLWFKSLYPHLISCHYFQKVYIYIYFPLIRCFAFFVWEQPMGIPIWECWGLLVGEFKLNFYRDQFGYGT